jgi:hypothetical protein
MKKTLFVISFCILVEESFSMTRPDSINNIHGERNAFSIFLTRIISLFPCCRGRNTDRRHTEISDNSSNARDSPIAHQLPARRLVESNNHPAGNNSSEEIVNNIPDSENNGNTDIDSYNDDSDGNTQLTLWNDALMNCKISGNNANTSVIDNAINEDTSIIGDLAGDTNLQQTLLNAAQDNRSINSTVSENFDNNPITLDDFTHIRNAGSVENFPTNYELEANNDVANEDDHLANFCADNADNGQSNISIVKKISDIVSDRDFIDVNMPEIQRKATIQLTNSHLIGPGKLFATINKFTAKCQSALLEQIQNPILRKLLVANSFGTGVNVKGLLAAIYNNAAEIFLLDREVYQLLEEMGVIKWSYDESLVPNLVVQCVLNNKALSKLLWDMDPGTTPRALIRKIAELNGFLILVYESIANSVVVRDDSIDPDQGIQNVSVNDLADTYSMLSNDSVPDTFFLTLPEANRQLRILTLPRQQNYYVIKQSCYDRLCDEDKQNANALIMAAYKHRLMQNLENMKNGDNSYLSSQKQIACYRPLPIKPGYTIRKKKKFYSMAALNDMTNFSIANISPVKLKQFMKNLFLKGIWLCLEKNSAKKVPDDLDGTVLMSHIAASLRKYLAGNIKSSWFDIVTHSISEEKTQTYFAQLRQCSNSYEKEQIINELQSLLLEQLQLCSENISDSNIGKCGVFFNEAIARYVIYRFQDLISKLEFIRKQKRQGHSLSPELTDTMDRALMVMGLLFQSLQHCKNGQQDGMIHVFSLLINSDNNIDTENINFPLLASCVFGIAANNIAIDIFQFKDEQNRDHAESASLFTRSISMMKGNYGLNASNAGNWFDKEQLPLLYNHLLHNHPNIIQQLDHTTLHTLTDTYDVFNPTTGNLMRKFSRADTTAICAATRNIFAIAMNMYLINTLLQPQYCELLKRLFSAYAKTTRRIPKNWYPSSPDVQKKLLEEILFTCGMLKYGSHHN